MLSQYIENLIQNIPKRDTPYELDVVLEGGIFNGSYEMGVLLFLKELEKKGYIHIKRFSGCSVGSMGALKYMLKSVETSINDWEMFRDQFRQNFNLDVLREIIERDTSQMDDETFNRIRKDVLYINYYDGQNKKQIVKSVFETREDIRDAILKSCHIPYLTNGDCYVTDDGKQFLDGGLPYIFPERYSPHSNKHILYISISHFSKLKNMIRTRNETTIHGRALEGVVDVYNFFQSEKSTLMCSFVDKWSLIDFTILRMKHIIILMSIYWLSFFKKMGNVVRPYAERYELFHELIPIWTELTKDWILYICF